MVFELNRPNVDISSKHVATAALKINVARASSLLRETFQNLLQTHTALNFLKDAPLVQARLLGPPLPEPIMLITILSPKSLQPHYIVRELSTHSVKVLASTDSNLQTLNLMPQNNALPLFVCANYSKMMLAVQCSLVAHPTGFGFSTYALSTFEIFDPFSEKLVLVSEAIPFIDTITIRN